MESMDFLLPGIDGDNTGRDVLLPGVDGDSTGRDVLLPGIDDDITEQLVVPKLPFSALQTLSWVSHPWRRAIKNRRIYDARARTESTQSLAILCHAKMVGFQEIKSELSLYTVEENCRSPLPPIPMMDGKNRKYFTCISLEGRLYLLGGATISDERRQIYEALNEVYVLDVAGMNWRWRQCASMRGARAQCGCGVSGGKIYAFGGWALHLKRGVLFQKKMEVYDPQEDAWSPIKRNPVIRGNDLNVTSIGEELLLYYHTSDPHELFRTHRNEGIPFCEVYNPWTDGWRSVTDFFVGPRDEFNREAVVVMGERILKLKHDYVYIYDMLTGVWFQDQSCSFKDLESRLGCKIIPWRILALNGELFLVGCPYENITSERFIFLRSQGLGSVNKKIIWHRLSEVSPYILKEVFSSIEF